MHACMQGVPETGDMADRRIWTLIRQGHLKIPLKCSSRFLKHRFSGEFAETLSIMAVHHIYPLNRTQKTFFFKIP